MTDIKISFILNGTLIVGLLELTMYLAMLSMIISNVDCTIVSCLLVTGIIFKFLITLYDLIINMVHHNNRKSD